MGSRCGDHGRDRRRSKPRRSGCSFPVDGLAAARIPHLHAALRGGHEQAPCPSPSRRAWTDRGSRAMNARIVPLDNTMTPTASTLVPRADGSAQALRSIGHGTTFCDQADHHLCSADHASEGHLVGTCSGPLAGGWVVLPRALLSKGAAALAKCALHGMDHRIRPFHLAGDVGRGGHRCTTFRST